MTNLMYSSIFKLNFWVTSLFKWFHLPNFYSNPSRLQTRHGHALTIAIICGIQTKFERTNNIWRAKKYKKVSASYVNCLPTEMMFTKYFPFACFEPGADNGERRSMRIASRFF